jgi:uncharacterized protein
MNLARLLIIAVAVWLAIYFLRRAFQHLNPPKSSERGATKNMVRCTHCGLHLPESEAINYQGQYFCCLEHRNLHINPG